MKQIPGLPPVYHRLEGGAIRGAQSSAVLGWPLLLIRIAETSTGQTLARHPPRSFGNRIHLGHLHRPGGAPSGRGTEMSIMAAPRPDRPMARHPPRPRQNTSGPLRQPGLHGQASGSPRENAPARPMPACPAGSKPRDPALF